MRDGLESGGPAEPDPARGARPAVGGVAAALLPGALGTSRIPRTAVIRFRSAGRHPLKGRPAGAGPIIGGQPRPRRPGDLKTKPVYGARPGTPGHAAIGKIKSAGRRLAHSVK